MAECAICGHWCLVNRKKQKNANQIQIIHIYIWPPNDTITITQIVDGGQDE